jgi:prolyl-tRNA synthetase
MKISKLVFETSKNAPQGAKIVSHVLLLRAGFIKQVANGIYTLGMPAQRMALKIENIIRSEMDKIGGQEVKFPVVAPKELWEASGRYDSIGGELARFKDRTGHDMVLGMTHEEASVHFAMNTVSSYQKLPFMMYQIQTKFRDELRSRGGLIRVREFTMKDAYSFHLTQEDLEEHYYLQHAAYLSIFNKIGLKNVISVKSDTGMMGGTAAHEFMLLTPDGEDEIITCPKCGYSANMEVAYCAQYPADAASTLPKTEVFTGQHKTIDEVSSFLNISPEKIIKAVVFAPRGEQNPNPIVVFLRGHLDVSESKLRRALKKDIVPFDASAYPALAYGNIGAIGLTEDITVVFDKSIDGAAGMATGANKPEDHLTGVDVGRDFEVQEFVDVAKVRVGDVCKHCGAPLKIENGIEIGNIFQLGDKYTQAMGMTVATESGEAIAPLMGCYGIGVGRAIAAVVQDSHDERGMILPAAIAPWTVHICSIRLDDSEVSALSFEIYDQLRELGIDTLIDDRNISPGIKFADADLMGMPVRLVVSPKGLAAGEVEIMLRKTKEAIIVKKESAIDAIQAIICGKEI